MGLRIVLKQAKSRDEYMKRPQLLDCQKKAIRCVSELSPLSLAINPSPAKKAPESVAYSNFRYGMPIATRRCLVSEFHTNDSQAPTSRISVQLSINAKVKHRPALSVRTVPDDRNTKERKPHMVHPLPTEYHRMTQNTKSRTQDSVAVPESRCI